MFKSPLPPRQRSPLCWPAVFCSPPGAALALRRRAVRARLTNQRSLVMIVGVGLAAGCAAEERTFAEEGRGTETPSVDGGSAGDTSGAFSSGGSSPGGDTGATSETPRSTSDGAVTGETAPGSESTEGSTSSGGAATIGSSVSGATEPPTNTSSAGEESTGSDLGAGEPPDYGDLGSGDGRLLIVNALSEASVDVWLAGADAPLVEALQRETARRQAVGVGEQRVVFTRAGTRQVVGCSAWFPLRDAEQWAVTAVGADHSCLGDGDGETLTFKQEQPLDGNPVRYVHATAPDRFAFARNDVAEPGVLAPGETLVGTSLPDCSSGCEVRYRVAADGVATSRYVTVQVATAEQLPPAGEVLLLVMGDVRQEWPAERDALRLLRVDANGNTYVLRRDPELAFARIGEGGASFSIVTPPSTTELLSVEPDCGESECALQTVNWRPGRQTFYVKAQEGEAELDVEFQAGHRYILLSIADMGYPLYWLGADFDRSDATEAYARGVNLDSSGDTLAIGYVFGDSAAQIEGLTSIPFGAVSEGETGGRVPAEEGWRLVTASSPEELGTDCFYSLDTEPGFRGYFVVSDDFQTLDVTSWPPVARRSSQLCF